MCRKNDLSTLPYRIFRYTTIHARDVASWQRAPVSRLQFHAVMSHDGHAL
jgi:hypothetical protein